MENKPAKDSPEEKSAKREVEKENSFQLYAALELVTKLGVSVALIAGGFLYAGIYLDRKFGTRYVFVLIFLLLSVVASIYDIYVLLEPIIGSEKRKNFLKRKKK